MASLAAIGNSVPPFLSKIYDMVDDMATDSVVSWSSGNNSFVVWNVPEFQKVLLPKYFKHSNFSSFVRQLNTYGFRKVDPDRFEFANEGFLRGQKHRLKSITRKKPAHAQNNQSPEVQSSSVAACVEVGKFGLDEEVERLKRDKNVLMQELVRLRQQQQTTDHQLQSVGQRVQVMEQRQQQMMSFLAKAMQSPGFLSQLVQQQNESSMHISGGTKKRRLPGQEEENLACENGNNFLNGQIVKFHPSMNEAAKAILQQILKMNKSPRLEPSMNNDGSFLFDNFSSSGALENNDSSTRFSAVTLSEVQSASQPPSLSVESGFSIDHPSTTISEVQVSPCHVMDNVKINPTSELKMHNSRPDTIMHNFNEQGIVLESSVGIPNVFGASETEKAEYIDSTLPVLDAIMPVESDAFSPDQDVDIPVDSMLKLPGINDVFWEQFLGTSPIIGNMDENNSTSPESNMTKEQELQSWQEIGWDKIQNMNHLTDQMELLTSSRRI